MNEKLIELYQHGGMYFAVMNHVGILYIESPSDQGIAEGEPQESVLRLFTDSNEALSYRDLVAQAHGSMKIVGLDLTALWELIPSIDRQSMKAFDCPLRVDVCSVDKDGWPISIDTLHSVFILWN